MLQSRAAYRPTSSMNTWLCNAFRVASLSVLRNHLLPWSMEIASPYLHLHYCGCCHRSESYLLPFSNQPRCWLLWPSLSVNSIGWMHCGKKIFLKNFPLTKPGDSKLNNMTHCLCLKNTIVKTNPVSPSYGSCFLPLFRLNLLVFSAVFHPGW